MTSQYISSAQSLSSVPDSLRPHESQHTRPPCLSPTPRVYSNSCPLNQLCHLIFCRPLLLPSSIFPNIRVFSNESVLCIRWPKYWSFSLNSRLVRQGCILSPCLFNFSAEYIMRDAGLEEAQAGIKIAGRNINNLRYADDTTLMAESEEELKSLLMKVKEESEKVWLKAQHSEN